MDKEFQKKINQLVISLRNDQESLTQLDDFYTKHATNDGSNEFEIKCLTHKSSILFGMGKFRDALNISYDLLGMLDKAHGSYFLTVLLVIQCEIALGQLSKAKNRIQDILTNETVTNFFYKLNLLRMLVDADPSNICINSYSEEIEELVSYFGFKDIDRSDLRGITIALHDQNKSSAQNFGKLLFKLNDGKDSERNKLISDYLKTETLEYYRKMACDHLENED